MAEQPQWAKRGEAANKELRKRQLDREEAQAKEQTAAVAAERAQMSVSDKTRERGRGDISGGMKLLSEAGARRSVRVANPTHRATRTYTDTLGTGARRKGLFEGQAQRLAPVEPRLPTPTEQIEAAQQVPVDAAPLEAVAQAPAVPGAVVPAGAMATGAPGLPAGQVPMEAAPLEGEPPLDETPEEELARLEAEAAGQTPEDLEALAAADYAEGLAQEMDPAPVQPNEGVLQRQMDAAEQLAQAKLNVEQGKADALTDASLQAQTALADASSAKADADAQLAHQLEASRVANSTVEDLTKKAAAMGAVDPRRAWSNMGIGRKIGFVIGIALGATGHAIAGRDPDLAMRPLRRYVEEDIRVQEEQLGKVGADITSARKVADDQGNLLAQTRAVTDDKESARAMVEAARFRQIKAQLMAKIAESGVGQASAEQQALLTALEEEIAGKQQAIDARAATNPEFFTKSVAVHDRGTRKAMELAGEGLIKSGLKSQESAEAQEGKLELKGADALLKQAEAAAKTKDKIASEAYKFGADTAVAQQVVGLIDKVLQQDDIAGYGFTAGTGLLPSEKSVDDDIDAIGEAFGRLQSQGVISVEEEVRFNEMLRGGTALGGESRLRKNLARVRGMVMLNIEAHERGMSKESRGYYNRNVRAADFGAKWTGGGKAKPIRED